MWIIIKNKHKKEVKYFKHKFIKYYLCIFINKLKRNEIEVLKYEKNN